MRGIILEGVHEELGLEGIHFSNDLLRIASLCIDYQQHHQQQNWSSSNHLAAPQQSHLRRSRSPGTPPLPDLPTPAAKPNQTETPSNHHQVYPHVQAAPTGGAGVRKHQRGEELPAAAGKPNSKRMHVEGKEGGRDQPLLSAAADKVGGGGKRKFGAGGRWSNNDNRGEHGVL